MFAIGLLTINYQFMWLKMKLAAFFSVEKKLTRA